MTVKNISSLRQKKSSVNRIDVESLSTSTDEELSSYAETFEEGRSQSTNVRGMRPFEEELAYIRREQQMRARRKRAHDVYVRALQDEWATINANEEFLPNFDDRCNRSFVDAWLRWRKAN